MGCVDSKESTVGGSHDAWKSGRRRMSHEVAPAAIAHSGKLAITDTLQDIQDDDAEMERAATKIQSTFRGHLARKQLQQQQEQNTGDLDGIEDLDLDDPELEKAATKIQASFRGHQVRRNDVLHQKEDEFYHEMEELHTKKRPHTPTEEEMNRAATKIQAAFRGHLVRKHDVLHQKEEELYHEMEQLIHTTPSKPGSKQHKPGSKHHKPGSKQHKSESKQHKTESKQHKPESKQHKPESKQHKPESEEHKPPTKPTAAFGPNKQSKQPALASWARNRF